MQQEGSNTAGMKECIRKTVKWQRCRKVTGKQECAGIAKGQWKLREELEYV